jgi:hypothetical protein
VPALSSTQKVYHSPQPTHGHSLTVAVVLGPSMGLFVKPVLSVSQSVAEEQPLGAQETSEFFQHGAVKQVELLTPRLMPGARGSFTHDGGEAEMVAAHEPTHVGSTAQIVVELHAGALHVLKRRFAAQLPPPHAPSTQFVHAPQAQVRVRVAWSTMVPEHAVFWYSLHVYVLPHSTTFCKSLSN